MEIKQLSDVIGDDVIAKIYAIFVLTAKSQFFARNFITGFDLFRGFQPLNDVFPSI